MTTIIPLDDKSAAKIAARVLHYCIENNPGAYVSDYEKFIKNDFFLLDESVLLCCHSERDTIDYHESFRIAKSKLEFVMINGKNFSCNNFEKYINGKFSYDKKLEINPEELIKHYKLISIFK